MGKEDTLNQQIPQNRATRRLSPNQPLGGRVSKLDMGSRPPMDPRDLNKPIKELLAGQSLYDSWKATGDVSALRLSHGLLNQATTGFGPEHFLGAQARVALAIVKTEAGVVAGEEDRGVKEAGQVLNEVKPHFPHLVTPLGTFDVDRLGNALDEIPEGTFHASVDERVYPNLTPKSYNPAKLRAWMAASSSAQKEQKV